MKIFVWTYLFFVGASGVYIIQPFFRVWIAYASFVMALFYLRFLKGNLRIDIYTGSALFLLLYLLGHALFFNREKSMVYMLAFAGVIILGFILPKDFLKYNCGRLDRVLDINSNIVTIISIIALVDFVFTAFNASSMFDTLTVRSASIATSRIGDIILPRAYGLSVEPNILAFYLVSLGLLGVHWRFKRVSASKSLPHIIIFALALLLTFSAAAYIVLCMSMIYLIIRNPRLMHGVSIKSTAMIIFSFSLLVIWVLSSSAGGKILGTTHTTSGKHRIALYEEAYDRFDGNNLFFGIGLGGVSEITEHKGSYLNWWLTFGVEVGLVGFAIMFLFIYLTIRNLKSLQGGVAIYFKLPLYNSIGFFFFTGSFYEPFLLILCAMIVGFANEKKTRLA